jgi:hypothetical protein
MINRRVEASCLLEGVLFLYLFVDVLIGVESIHKFKQSATARAEAGQVRVRHCPLDGARRVHSDAVSPLGRQLYRTRSKRFRTPKTRYEDQFSRALSYNS